MVQPAPAAWDGFARLGRGGSGVITLFRNKSLEPVATIRLPLMPAGGYKLQSIVTGKELGVFAQADWVRGIPIRFSDSEPVEVLEVTAVHE